MPTWVCRLTGMIRVSNRVIQLSWLLVSAALALFALGSIFTAVQTVLADARLETGPPVQPAAPAPPTQHPRSAFAALSSSPVFGALSERPGAARPVRAPTPVLANLQETNLKLRLVGTVSTGPGIGFAIIENQAARTQKLYEIGDSIVDGAMLHGVYEQLVVLIRNGRQEVLKMLTGAMAVPPGASAGTRVQRSFTRAGRSRASAVGGRNRRVPQATGPVRRINDNLRVIVGDRFQREIGPDLLQTIDSVYTEPRMVGGQPSGLVLRDLGRGDVLSSLGFQEGDVVISVNGRRVNSQQDLIAMGDTMMSANDIRVQVIRKNLPRHLIFKVR